MLKPPTQPVPVDAATVIFDLMSDILDVADHMDANYTRASVAMQLANGSITPVQALAYVDGLVDR